MKHPDPWLKLVAAARRAPAEEEVVLPVGLATRVAAQGLAQRREPADFLGVWAWRALTLALAVMITSAAVSYPTLAGTLADDDLDDPVAELVAQL